MTDEYEIIVGDENNTDAELRALYDWLTLENNRQFTVRYASGRTGSDEMGVISDSLVAALGAGGAGALLAQSLVTWLKTRRPTVTLKIKAEAKIIEVDAGHLPNSDALVERIAAMLSGS